jgi:hypothetical protein
MVYQEQVMRILNRLGGIELAKAYSCIKAISKKKGRTSPPTTTQKCGISPDARKGSGD